MNFKPLFTVHWLWVTVSLFSCTPTPTPASKPQTSFVIYRLDPSAFVEFTEDFHRVKEIPFAIPSSCGLHHTFPAPLGRFIAIEFNCPNGQAVLFLDVESGASIQSVAAADSHFLAWTRDGTAAYLKVDSLGNPRVIRAQTDGKQKQVPITEFTYDLSVSPVNDDFTFTFSRGLGYGSEIWLAQDDGRVATLLHADQFNYISFARFSPDGKQIAFIKIPDTPTPFTVGELWVMSVDGSRARKLADADAGHGFAANWSPDGTRIAFVMRENPEDESANRSSDALVSNIYVVHVDTGALTPVTHFTAGRAETPFWSPNGNTLAFSAVIDGRMTVSIANVDSGEIVVIESPACCPAWTPK